MFQNVWVLAREIEHRPSYQCRGSHRKVLRWFAIASVESSRIIQGKEHHRNMV